MLSTHVLVLEEDDILSRMYEKALIHAHFKTLRCSTIDKAIDHLMEFDPDVVCIDWKLENNTTEGFLEYLQTLPARSIPRVMLLTDEIDHYHIMPYADLISGVLPKSMTITQLVYCVKALAQENPDRVPLQAIQHHLLAENVILMEWQGYITQKLIRRTMIPELYEMPRVILDIRKLNILRLDLSSFPPAHSPLPHLEYLCVVHNPDDKLTAQFLTDYLRSAVDTHVSYCTDLEAAKEAIFDHI